MDDYAQYSNMMNQINQINQSGKEIVNEKKEDQQEKLNEYKKTLEMTTEGIGGGILHDTGISLIKKGFSALKNKIPVPAEELENMLKDYKEGGATKMFEGMTKRGYSKAKSKIFGQSTDGEDGENAVKKVFGNLFKTGKAQNPKTIETKPEDNLQPITQEEIDKLPPPSDDTELPEPIKEPDFDNVSSKTEFKAQNKLLKDKVNTLDKDTQKRIKTDVDNDPTIKKNSEIGNITDPDEQLVEAQKRGKAINARADEEINKQPLPPPPEEEIEQKAKTTLSRLQPVEEDVGKETDTASSGGKSFVSRLFGKAKAVVDPSLVDNEEDSGILQRPKQLGGKILQGLGQDEEEGGSMFGGLLGGIDKIGQAGLLGSQLFKKGETGKQRENILGSTAKQTVIDNVKDEATDAVSGALKGQTADQVKESTSDTLDDTIDDSAKTALKTATDDTLDTTLKTTAEKAGTRLAETDLELGGPEDPFGDVISGLVGLGTLLGGIFGAKKKHLPPTPSYVPINPTFQSGA